ncbi:MAG TPA: MFS transporter, partial [Solirubrobacteraceae bacterium]|nr:MFS transporter [Solirubrobacteraceae bacterium]
MARPMVSTGLQRYRAVLRAPQVAPLVASALVAVLPIGMGTLAVVVFVQRQTGSYGTAGLVAAALALGAAVATPMLGRLIDRVGQARVLVPCAVVSPVALAGIVPVADAGASAGALGAVAFVAGSSAPPVLSCLRSMWPTLLGGDGHLVRTGLAVDALLLEAAFIAGPLVAAILIAAVSPQSALLVAAGATMAGTLAFAAASPMRNTRGAARTDRRLLGPLRAQGLQTILLATFPVGVLFGGFDVIAPAIGEAAAKASVPAIVAPAATRSALCGE